MKRGKKNFKLSSKIFYIFAAIIILAAIGSGVHAAIKSGPIALRNPSHQSSQVYIEYSSTCYFTLANAITNGYLTTPNLVLSGLNCDAPPFPKTSPYYLASQVLINVGPYIMTLQEAFDNSVFTTASAPNYGATRSYTITPSGAWGPSTEIYANTATGSTLQDAINSNSICASNMGQACYPSGSDPSCTSAGTINCQGSCVGSAFSSWGTQSTCPQNEACD